MSDLLNNVLPHFAVASFGLGFCEVKLTGLQVIIDLFCPNLLGCGMLDPQVNRSLLPESEVTESSHWIACLAD